MASSSKPPARGWEVETGHGVALFTEAELAAADQLVQLSGSGGGGWDGGASPSSSSSSQRSVNTAAVAWEMEERDVVRAGSAGEELDRRARKRYRLLSDLYAATRPAAIGACLGADTAYGARKRKRHGEAAVARYGDQSCY